MPWRLFEVSVFIHTGLPVYVFTNSVFAVFVVNLLFFVADLPFFAFTVPTPFHVAVPVPPTQKLQIRSENGKSVTKKEEIRCEKLQDTSWQLN